MTALATLSRKAADAAASTGVLALCLGTGVALHAALAALGLQIL